MLASKTCRLSSLIAYIETLHRCMSIHYLMETTSCVFVEKKCGKHTHEKQMKITVNVSVKNVSTVIVNCIY